MSFPEFPGRQTERDYGEACGHETNVQGCCRCDWVRYLNEHRAKIKSIFSPGGTAAVASEMAKAELEAGSRFAILRPQLVEKDSNCTPGVHYTLLRDGDCMSLCHGQRFIRLMTHPADARAGWHLVPHLGFEVMPLSMIDQEVRFDAFHWALSRGISSGIEGHMILEHIRFHATAVLRAPEPRPMVHGLWVKFYDGRCRSPDVDYYERIAKGLKRR